MRTEQAIRRLDQTIPMGVEDRALTQVENDGSHTAAPGLPSGMVHRGGDSQVFPTNSGTFTGDLLGRVIGGRFEVQRRLVHDSFGLVLSALDRKTGSVVSLRLVESAQVAGRLGEGLSTVAHLVHPGLLTVSGVLRSGRPLAMPANPEEGSAIIVQGALEGRPVGQFAVDRLTATPVSLEEACRIVSQVASALTAVHTTGPHGAVGPETVWVDGKDGVLLTDLVLARALLNASADEAEARETRRVLMLAPELQRGLPPQKASDVYGLSALLYVLLTGRAPGEAWTAASKLHAEAGRAVDGVLRRGLSATPGVRHATPEAFQTALVAAVRADKGQVERPKKQEIRASSSALPKLAPMLSRRPSERPPASGSMNPPPALFSMRDSGASLPLIAQAELPKQAAEVRVELPPTVEAISAPEVPTQAAQVEPDPPALIPQSTAEAAAVVVAKVEESLPQESMIAQAEPAIVSAAPALPEIPAEQPPQVLQAPAVEVAESYRAAESTLPMRVVAPSDDVGGAAVVVRVRSMGKQVAERLWHGFAAKVSSGVDLTIIRNGLYLLLFASLVALFSMRSSVEQGAKLLRAQAELTRFVKSFRRESAERTIKTQVETLGLVSFVVDTAAKGKRGLTKSSQTVWVRPLATVRLESLAQISAYATHQGALTVHALDGQALASSLSWRLARAGRSTAPVLKGVDLSWSQFSEDDLDLELEVAALRQQSLDARKSLKDARRTMPRRQVVKGPVGKANSQVALTAGKAGNKAPTPATGLTSKASSWGSQFGMKPQPAMSKSSAKAQPIASKPMAKAPLTAAVSRQVASQRAAARQAGRVVSEKRRLSDEARARYEQAAMRAEERIMVPTDQISSVAAAQVTVSYGAEDHTFAVPVPVKEQVVPVAPLPNVSFEATRATGMWDALKHQTPASALGDLTARLPWHARPMSVLGLEFRGIRLLQALPCMLLGMLGVVSLSTRRRKHR